MLTIVWRRGKTYGRLPWRLPPPTGSNPSGSDSAELNARSMGQFQPAWFPQPSPLYWPSTTTDQCKLECKMGLAIEVLPAKEIPVSFATQLGPLGWNLLDSYLLLCGASDRVRSVPQDFPQAADASLGYKLNRLNSLNCNKPWRIRRSIGFRVWLTPQSPMSVCAVRTTKIPMPWYWPATN